MKQFLEPLLIFSFLIFFSYTNQEEIQLAAASDCQQYVDLNFSNYDSLRNDPISLIHAKVESNCLILTLQYSGGCKEHKVDLALIHPWCGTPPLPPPTFEIRHDSNDDHCKALVTKDYHFDISGIREQGRTSVDFILSVKNSSGVIASKTYTYSY